MTAHVCFHLSRASLGKEDNGNGRPGVRKQLICKTSRERTKELKKLKESRSIKNLNNIFEKQRVLLGFLFCIYTYARALMQDFCRSKFLHDFLLYFIFYFIPNFLQGGRSFATDPFDMYTLKISNPIYTRGPCLRKDSTKIYKFGRRTSSSGDCFNQVQKSRSVQLLCIFLTT